MKTSPCGPHHDSAETICPHCHARVWAYQTVVGDIVLLDDARGGRYVVDGHGNIFFSDRGEGFQGHKCSSAPAARSYGTPISEDEFLWP